MTRRVESLCRTSDCAPGCDLCAFIAAVDEHTPEGFDLVCGDSDNDNEFSWQACETCGSVLGGSRHEMAFIKPAGPATEVIKVMGCTDCLMYVANGELPVEPWRSGR